MIFLNRKDVEEFHGEQLKAYGGYPGIRDETVLESALSAPQWIYQYLPESSLFDLAAAYLYHLCTDHPFFDGNKRAAFSCALAFLALNGAVIEAPDDELFQLTMEVAEGKIGKAAISQYLQQHVK